MANDAVVSLAEPSTQRSRVLGGKYLTFKLGDEEYGLEILRVREIIGLMPITAVPRTPEAVRGVINLRGKIIPVLDLRQKFGMGRVEDTELTCVIVVDADVKGLPAQMGLLVDSVSEVVDVLDDQVEEAPSFGEGLDTSFLLGMAKHRGAVKILLNTEAVLSEPGVVDIATSMSPDLARSQDSSDGEG